MTFYDCLERGDYEAVLRQITVSNKLVELVFDSDERPLHVVTAAGHVQLIRLLLEYGADINSKGFEGDSPLHCAVSAVNIELTTLLCENGANIHATNDFGATPLAHAARNLAHPDGFELLEGDIYRFLKEKGAEYDLLCACYFSDERKIFHMLSSDRSSIDQFSHEDLFSAVVYHEWGTDKQKIRILQNLVKGGLRISEDTLAEAIESFEEKKGDLELARYLTKLAEFHGS